MDSFEPGPPGVLTTLAHPVMEPARPRAPDRDPLHQIAEQAHHEAEIHAATLCAVLEAQTDGICIVQRRSAPRCNVALLGLLGARSLRELQIEPDELVRRFRLRRDRDGPLLEAGELPLVQALRGHPAALDLWATQLHGRRHIFLRFSAVPLPGATDAGQAVLVCRDLSGPLQLHQRERELRRMEAALGERDAELRALTDGVRDHSIYTIDPTGLITSWHQGAQLMKGYSAQEAIGMPFGNLFTPEERALGQPEREMRIAAETGEYKGDGQRLRKDGRAFEVAVVLTPLRGPRGDLRGYLELTQDITERKRLEREREDMLQDAQRARAEAERADHSKGEFLATISHELRTPLSAILGWAQVLERGAADAETVQHGLKAISRNARIQVQLIEALLDMNQIESGRLHLDLKRIELGDVIAVAVDSALPAAAAKGIGLRTLFASTTVSVMGDAARLQQVVANLLSNAVRFTPSGGQVSVALTHADGQAQIAVADSGQGMEPAFLARAFASFEQQDGGITRRHGGLGIGLAIVHHLVQLHGGTVGAQSPGAGLGATFTITLPVAPATLPSGHAPGASRSAAGALPAAAARLDGLRVLLVDDEADLRALTARVLQDAGAQILLASSADEGLALLRQAKPSVMLSDIGMPLVDGYELMRRVRALPEAEGGCTPAAAYTAYAGAEDAAQAMQAGYQLHLPKPLDPAALVMAVAGLARAGAVRSTG